jgi:hypothetical protein
MFSADLRLKICNENFSEANTKGEKSAVNKKDLYLIFTNLNVFNFPKNYDLKLKEYRKIMSCIY